MRTAPFGRTPNCRSRRAMRHPLRTCPKNFARSAASPKAAPPPVGGHTGATTVPIWSFRDDAFSASCLTSSSLASILTWGSKRKRSKPSNFAPSNSAAAVRSSIVSRPMGGSPPSPLPTTPGQAALWSFG